MSLEHVLRILTAHREELREQGVRSLSVFGSVARGEAREDSDVDLLVEFDRPIGLFGFVRLQRRLSELLSRRVDLVTLEALREPMRQEILREAVHAA